MRSPLPLIIVVLGLAGCSCPTPKDSPIQVYPGRIKPDFHAAAEVNQGARKTAIAAWWGFCEQDSTEFLQAALDSGADIVIIPNMGQPWIVRPIFLRSNQHLIFEPGTVIQARSGYFLGPREALLSAIDCDHISISGRGATLRMHRSDYLQVPYPKAEWRHGLNLRGCSNITITDLTIENTGGDGIYLGRSKTDPNRIACRDITIQNCACINNHRQGMSIVSAENVLVEQCQFIGTRGTAPSTGVDLEPNNGDEPLNNIIFRNCTFAKNAGGGLQFWLDHMTPAAGKLHVEVQSCAIHEIVPFSLYIHGLDRPDSPHGVIRFNQTQFHGLKLIGGHPSVRVEFK